MAKKPVIHSAVKGGTKTTKEVRKVIDNYFAQRDMIKAKSNTTAKS